MAELQYHQNVARNKSIDETTAEFSQKLKRQCTWLVLLQQERNLSGLQRSTDSETKADTLRKMDKALQ